MSQQENTKKLEISERLVLLRKRVGNQSDLAKLLDISSDYVSMIETGKRKPSSRLMKDVEELERKFGLVKSVISDSVEPGLELHDQPPEYLTTEECKQRIKQLEDDNARLRAMVFAAAAPLSSRPPLSEAQAIAKQSGDEHDRHPKK